MGYDFSGKTVIVTGASRGIGLAIGREFLRAGAALVSTSRSELDSVPAAEGIDGAEERSLHLGADHRKVEDVERIVATARERFGRIDVLVNNAGGSPMVDTATVSPNFLSAVVTNNLVGPMILAQAANRVMQDQPDGGTILNISSMAGERVSKGLVPYGAAKAGLTHISSGFAAEWGPKVRVNAVVPGIIETEAVRDGLLPAYEEQGQKVGDRIALGRIGSPTEVARLCLFLASDQCPFINGAAIHLDGGPAIQRV